MFLCVYVCVPWKKQQAKCNNTPCRLGNQNQFRMIWNSALRSVFKIEKEKKIIQKRIVQWHAVHKISRHFWWLHTKKASTSHVNHDVIAFTPPINCSFRVFFLLYKMVVWLCEWPEFNSTFGANVHYLFLAVPILEYTHSIFVFHSIKCILKRVFCIARCFILHKFIVQSKCVARDMKKKIKFKSTSLIFIGARRAKGKKIGIKKILALIIEKLLRAKGVMNSWNI